MRNSGDVIASILFMVIGIGAAVGAIGLRVGTATQPQAGFFPFWGGITLVILSGLLFFRAWRGQSVGGQALGRLRNPTILLVGLVFYAAALETVGYLIATAIVSAIVLYVLETESLRVLVLASLILAIGSYILFGKLLDVPLPGGILTKFW